MISDGNQAVSSRRGWGGGRGSRPTLREVVRQESQAAAETESRGEDQPAAPRLAVRADHSRGRVRELGAARGRTGKGGARCLNGSDLRARDFLVINCRLEAVRAQGAAASPFVQKRALEP